MTTKIWQLTTLGQSLWYDYIERRMLDNGELAAMISQGDIRGLTSNPSIFNQAIAKTKDYDSALIPMAWSGYTAPIILKQLMVEDIQRTADLLKPLFDLNHGEDGFVSLEVQPDMAYDTEKTIEEAQHLWETVNRPNVMIKIPATKPGLEAIRQSIAAGINVNITLIFSIHRYKEVMEAYLSGIEDRVQKGEPVNQINSVASFFVSRIDSKVDKYLEPIIRAEGSQAEMAAALPGTIAIANARLAYQEFRQVFESERFEKLKTHGAKLQRPLWASTSTKNPTFPDTMYVDELIGANTVNTVPPQTLEAFKDHGKVELTIEKDLELAAKQFADLESLGISMQQVTQELEEEGVKAFSEAFDSLLSTIDQRREQALMDIGLLAEPVARQVAFLEANDFNKRFHAKDASLWTDDPKGQEEVRIRMGWLSSPDAGTALVPEIEKFAAQVKEAGLTHALLMGMGGSSLASEVMSEIYGKEAGGLKLTILDSTDPAQVLQAAKNHPISRTLFILSSKSGGTAEIMAMFNYFWPRAQNAVGDKAGEHFITITDPGTSLEKLAFENNFRKIFLANPNVGGRYSVLTAFGLVPAGLMGINVQELLDCAAWMASECTLDKPLGRCPGFILGIVLGEAAKQGRDKLTIIADPALAPFGAWLEQLVAESSGKQGKGIVPIIGEPLVEPEQYGQDRIFYYFRRDGKYDKNVDRLRQAGFPVLIQDIQENIAIASEFYKWEIAIAAACAVLGVNPFDQPDVQDSKNRTLVKISYFKSHQSFDTGQPELEEDGISLFGKSQAGGKKLKDQVVSFLELGQAGEYVAINVFIARDRKNEKTLQKLRTWVMEKTGLATTVGFGPRYLHSTGQLHKGGANNGLFLVLTCDPEKDVDIPRENLSFGNLIRAQALGDLEALAARQRRVMHIHLASPDLIERLVGKLVD